MYRKLVLVLTLICVSASLAVAWQPLLARRGVGRSDPVVASPVAPGGPAAPGSEPASSEPAGPSLVPLAALTSKCTGPVSCFLINSFLPWLLLLALIRGATFHPGRRPPLPLTALKYLAALACGLLSILLLWTETRSMAEAAHILSTQTAQGPVTAWVASQAPHGVLRIFALSLLLAAPVFWLVRGARLGLPRATFEGWVQVRRLALPALAVLALAAAIKTYVTPNIVAWLIQ